MRDDAMAGEPVATMTVTGTSPDRNIQARLFDDTKIQIRFRPGAYDRYDEAELAHQLSRLGMTTFVAWSRERMERYRQSLGVTMQEAEQAQKKVYDPRREQYTAALNAIEAEGGSTGGSVWVRTVGMTRWQVGIERGALDDYDERGFLGEIASAFGALSRDRRTKVIMLKGEHFNLGVPRRWIDLMNQARTIQARAASRRSR